MPRPRFPATAVREDPRSGRAPVARKPRVVPEGFDTYRKPRLLVADQVILALVVLNSPVEPGCSPAPCS